MDRGRRSANDYAATQQSRCSLREARWSEGSTGLKSTMNGLQKSLVNSESSSLAEAGSPRETHSILHTHRLEPRGLPSPPDELENGVSWILHPFHENQSYSTSVEQQQLSLRRNRDSGPNALCQQSNLAYICYVLHLTKQSLEKLYNLLTPLCAFERPPVPLLMLRLT